MKNMNKAKGFTLIELVIVIVILGILAVTAAPKFLNLQDDARVATLKGLQGAMKSAAAIVYAKAAMKGVETTLSSSVTVNGDTIGTRYGYPVIGTGTSPAVGIELVVEGINSDQNPDFDYINKSTSTKNEDSVRYGYDGFECEVRYTEAKSATEPFTVELITSGSPSAALLASCQ